MSFRTEPTLAPSIEDVAPPAWGLALALFVALILQSSFVPQLQIRGAFPSLVLTLVVWYALQSGLQAGVLYGTIAGFCEDAFAATTGAAWMLSTGLVALVAGALGAFPIARTRLAAAAIAAFLTVTRFILFLLVERMEGLNVVFVAPHMHAVLWQGLFNGLLLSFALTVQARIVAYRVAHR